MYGAAGLELNHRRRIWNHASQVGAPDFSEVSGAETLCVVLQTDPRE